MKLFACIHNEGSGELLAWRHPSRQFVVGSQLLVDVGEVAVLLLPGHPPQLFEPGRHTLRTPVLPLLDWLVRLPFGGASPYRAELWYLSTRDCTSCRWGTDSPVQQLDSRFGILLSLRAYGRFDFRVSDPVLFLTSFCRNLSNGRADSRWASQLLRDSVTGVVKDAISRLVQAGGMTGLGGNLVALSQEIAELLQPEFGRYGLTLLGFYLSDVSPTPEEGGLGQVCQALADRAAEDIRGREGQT